MARTTSRSTLHHLRRLSRLIDARHFIGGPAGASNTNTERLMEYDRNGNLTSLQRYGDSPSDCSTLLFGYTGNRLTAADKIGSRIIWMYNFGYDLNGNRSSDSRTALEFTYNLLNLPCEVRDSQDNMQMRYTYLSTDSAFRYRYAGKEEQRFGGLSSKRSLLAVRT